MYCDVKASLFRTAVSSLSPRSWARSTSTLTGPLPELSSRTCQAHAACSGCTVSVTLLRRPWAWDWVHSTDDGPRLQWATPDPVNGDQPDFPSLVRQRRSSRKSPSSAGPGSSWLTRVAPWRMAKSAPPGVTCATKPEREASSSSPKSETVCSLEMVDRSDARGRSPPADRSCFTGMTSGDGVDTGFMNARADGAVNHWDQWLFERLTTL